MISRRLVTMPLLERIAGRDLVPAGFFRGQVAGLLDSDQIEAGGRKFRDFGSVLAAQFHLEDAGTDQFASRPFIHGEETAVKPVPAVVAVGVVDAHQDLHLGLSPKARPVGWAQPDAGIEVSLGVLAIAAGELDSWLVIWIFFQVVIRQKLKAGFSRARHLVFGMELHPLSACADAVTFVLIRTEGDALSADRNRR